MCRALESPMNDADRSTTYLPLLRQVQILSDLPEEPARFVAGGSLLRTLSRGQILCEKGKKNAGFFCLLAGRVKLSAISADGGERVVELVLPGRALGQAAAVMDQPFPFLAQALCESQVLQVGRERLHEAVGRWPEFTAAMLTSVSQDCLHLIHDLEACCLMSAGERLVDFLIKESEGEPGPGDAARLLLPASKAVVASRLNLTPETFSRELHELARQGLIEVERRSVRIPSLEYLGARLRRSAPEAA